MKIKKLNCPYHKDVRLAWGFTADEINRWFNRQRLDVTPWSASQAGRFMVYEEDGYTVNILLLPKKVDAGTISHELLHLAWEVLHRQSGIGFSDESEEAFAYYISCMSYQCEAAMMNRRKVKK